MTVRTTVCSCVVVVAWLMTPVSAASECVKLPAKELAKAVMEDKTTELVFSGTVVAITRTAELGYRATFDVDRVWKGAVTKEFELYIWELRSENPGFLVEQTYIVLATRLVTPREREGVGVSSPDTVAFTPVQCSDSSLLDPNLVRYLGAGVPPKR